MVWRICNMKRKSERLQHQYEVLPRKSFFLATELATQPPTAALPQRALHAPDGRGGGKKAHITLKPLLRVRPQNRRAVYWCAQRHGDMFKAAAGPPAKLLMDAKPLHVALPLVSTRHRSHSNPTLDHQETRHHRQGLAACRAGEGMPTVANGTITTEYAPRMRGLREPYAPSRLSLRE